ncbi:hypothetical protein B7463_g8657, partial [Scytalidium lignicola]
MNQRTRKPPTDPVERFLFADLPILAYLERSHMDGPSIEYFENDVKWYYKEHHQRAISTSETESKLQSFWSRWHASGDNPMAWKKIYDLGLKGLPRLPEEQKELVRQMATALKDDTTGTPRRIRSNSAVPRALLGLAKKSSRSPVANPSSSGIRKSRKYDGSPTQRKARERMTAPPTTRRSPSSRTPARALSTSLFRESCNDLANIKVEIISSHSPFSPEQTRGSTEQTCGSQMTSQLDDLRNQKAQVMLELGDARSKNVQIISELDDMKRQVAQLKLDLEDLRYRKAKDTQHWERRYRKAVQQRDSFKRQYKDMQADHNKGQDDIVSNNLSLRSKNNNLQEKLDSCRDVLQFKEPCLEDFRARNVQRAIELIDQLVLKLHKVLQGQDALFAIEKLDHVEKSGVSALFKRALGLGINTDNSGRSQISTANICRIQLRLVVLSLASTALCTWVFEAEVGALFQENNLAYSKLQSLLTASDKDLTRSFEFAAHEKCIDDPFICEVVIPRRAQHLAQQIREYIMPLLEAHKGLDEQYEDIMNEWLGADRQLAEIFEQALYAKVTLLLSTDKYKCALYLPGTRFDKSIMENKVEGIDNGSHDKQEEEVDITIFPGITRYASKDGFNYNRFFGAKKAPKGITPEVLRRAEMQRWATFTREAGEMAAVSSVTVASAAVAMLRHSHLQFYFDIAFHAVFEHQTNMNQPSEKPKQLSKEDYLDLMRKYSIEFEGRIVPEKWGKYATLFHEIRSIGNLTTKRFAEMHRLDDPYFLDKKITASKLVEGAWNCLRNMDSEIGWRQTVESKALERFDSEVICHVCHNRRWKSQFQAMPTDPAQAERLRRRRQERVLCECTPLQQSGINANDRSSPMFTRRADIVLKHEDIVIGLGVPESMRHYLQSLQTAYCPYKTKNIAYPFLVVEAKAAENSDASFGSIFRQTAFVIRTCLQLQQNLKEETEETEETDASHQCIVWSFAVIGEEWRLHAAVLNDNKQVQIFDLWHGTVLFEEGALQLLLIVDYLCDWASEIYRRSIMRCLTRNRLSHYPSMSPSVTDISSLAGDAEFMVIRAMSLPSRSSLMPEPSNDELGSVDDSSPEFLKIRHLIQVEPAILSDRVDTYSWQRWVTPDQDLRPWAKTATIRHSNLMELTSLQVVMPEKIHLIKTCLALCFPGFPIKEAARKLLISLQDDNLAVTTAVKAISWQGDQPKESILEVRALVYFRSGLRPEDWQITRQILCILCSEKAIQGLAQITGISPFINRSSNTTDAQCEQFLRAINSLNLIGGNKSAGLALARPHLFIRAVSDGSGSSLFEWSSFCLPRAEEGVTGSRTVSGFTGDNFFDIMSKALTTQDVSIPPFMTLYIEKKSCSYTIPGVSGQRGPPAEALHIPNFPTQGVIVKKPKNSWSETTPEFCFLVTNEQVQFGEEKSLGELLEESYRAKEFYLVSRNTGSYSRSDRALIDNWFRDLKGQLPRDTALERVIILVQDESQWVLDLQEKEGPKLPGNHQGLRDSVISQRPGNKPHIIKHPHYSPRSGSFSLAQKLVWLLEGDMDLGLKMQSLGSFFIFIPTRFGLTLIAYLGLSVDGGNQGGDLPTTNSTSTGGLGGEHSMPNNVPIVNIPGCTSSIAPTDTFTLMAVCASAIDALPPSSENNNPPGPAPCDQMCDLFRLVTATCCGIGGNISNPILIPPDVSIPDYLILPAGFIPSAPIDLPFTSFPTFQPLPYSVNVPPGTDLSDLIYPPIYLIPGDQVPSPVIVPEGDIPAFPITVDGITYPANTPLSSLLTIPAGFVPPNLTFFPAFALPAVSFDDPFVIPPGVPLSDEDGPDSNAYGGPLPPPEYSVSSGETSVQFLTVTGYSYIVDLPVIESIATSINSVERILTFLTRPVTVLATTTNPSGPPPTFDPIPGYTILGCYDDSNPTAWLLIGNSITDSTPTVEGCVDFCENNFLVIPIAGINCKDPCGGDAAEACDRLSSIVVYTTITPTPTQPTVAMVLFPVRLGEINFAEELTLEARRNASYLNLEDLRLLN